MVESSWNFSAAVLEAQNKPLAIKKLVLPAPEVGQVAVRVHYSGICGKQLVEQDGTLGPDKFLPHCLGHEGSGTVVGVGTGVTKVKVGDPVVLHWRPGSGIEAPSFPSYPERGSDLYIGGGKVTTFQRYSVVSENRVTPIPSNFPLNLAALLGCAVTTGLGLVANEAKVSMGQSVLVLGCGGVGLNVLQGCRMASAYPIVGVDRYQDKLPKARSMGASHVFTARELQSVADILDGGADVVVDTTGSPSAAKNAIELCRPGGQIFFVAQMRHDQAFQINSSVLHSGKRITASFGGSTNPDIDIPRYIRLHEAGLLNLPDLITHVCRLEDINKMLDLIRAGSVGRALINMDLA